MQVDSKLSKNFTKQELACSCCGKCEMFPEMVNVLQTIRNELGKPVFVSSGYRCHNHPVESMKEIKGEHTFGMAVDIICHGAVAHEILRLAKSLGVTRIGMNQKGRASSRFIHIGIGDKYLAQFPSHALWTY